jgi:hypothetical protein
MASDSEPKNFFWTFKGYLGLSKIGLLGTPSFLLVGARPPVIRALAVDSLWISYTAC